MKKVDHFNPNVGSLAYGPTLVILHQIAQKINELVDAVNELSEEPVAEEVVKDGIHGAGGPYYEVVYKGEVVEKVKGKSKAEEAYEALLAAE
jgi:hypothetical protein